MTSGLDHAQIKQFYRLNARLYDWTRWPILRHRRQAVDALELRPGQRVLDVGCGTGLSARLMRRGVGGSGRIIGVDLCEPMLHQSRKRGISNLDLICADAALLPLKGGLDAAHFAYSLSMIPDWKSAIAGVCALLKPAGRVVILDFGMPSQEFSPLRSIFERYILRSCIDVERDFAGALSDHVARVELIRPADSFITLVRGTR